MSVRATTLLRPAATIPVPRRARRRAPWLGFASLVLAACAAGDNSATPSFGSAAGLWSRLLSAEDARAATPEMLEALREGARSTEPDLRRWAVRALGRLERADLVPDIRPLLTDSVASVRAEAANALAQAVLRGAPEEARAALLDGAAREPDAPARGVFAESLGRVRHDTGERAQLTAQILLKLSRTSDGADAPRETLLGVVRGLFFLARQPGSRGGLAVDVPARLGELSAYGIAGPPSARPATGDSAVLLARRIRTVATAALVSIGGASAAQLQAVLGDPDPFVRREAALGAGALQDHSAGRTLAESALQDSAGVVRYEALRVLGRLAADDSGCETIRSAAADPNDHVAILAIDLLGARCASMAAVATVLDSIAATLPESAALASTDSARGAEGSAPAGVASSATGSSSWHRAAHALVALASADRALAATRLPRFAGHGDAFVRAYAAQVADTLRDVTTLHRLATDDHANVRTVAVDGLRRVAGHDADSVYIAQLSASDSQLLQAAARALQRSREPTATAALLDALDRVTARRRETERDARRALLERIGELRNRRESARLQAYLRDFDPAIAAQAADVLGAWTGSRPEPTPTRLPAQPLPTLEELETLARSRLVLELANGGTVELRLFPFDAPANAARFARLAREGYYDGLTLHRVAPNFVVQGGSPGANEYAGDGPFTRDELGLLRNWRGTVGLSTRGRDTGDAQLFINLVDNVRLDHEYTVWAEVVRGMDVVDAMLEGAVMQRVFVR